MAATLYNEYFYREQSGPSLRSAREVVPIVLSLLASRSVVDVGCGVGTWLSVFRECGVNDVVGLDGEYVKNEQLQIPGEKFIPSDLNGNYAFDQRFDLAMSLEVAEHLSEEFAAGFVRDLASFSSVVLFSAAIPGQGGVHHVNEQWPAYWRGLFADRGYIAVDCIRPRIWNNRKIEVSYRQNIVLYVEEGYLKKSVALSQEKQRHNLHPFSVVHPDLFQECLSRPPTLRPLVRALPRASLKHSRLVLGDPFDPNLGQIAGAVR